MKTEDNLLGLAENLVGYGRKNGASQIQVSISKSKDFSVEIREGNIENLQDAGSTGLSLKVIVDKKVATASSSDLSKDTLTKLIDNAIERAKYSSQDEFSALAEKEELKVNISDLKLFDPKIQEISPEKQIKTAKELEAICKADKRIKLSLGSFFGTSIGDVIMANSNGFSGTYKYSNCSTGVSLQAGDGENLFDDGWYESSITADGLMNIEEIAKIALHRVTRLIGGKKISTQNVPIILEPSMTSMLLGFLSECVHGQSVYMNRSFLVGKAGEKIASDIVNIIDDGLMSGKPGTRPFDGEGVPTRKTPVIENGVLKNYLLDTYSARKLNMKSTGNGSGTTNFYLEAGKYSPEEIIKSVDKGLYLTQTIGQGTVATTGDISKGAYGLWIENGELTYPVAEITISGNLGKILKDIEMLGNDLNFRRSITGPTIKIKEMTISGK
jgi:PmbA protein